MTFNLLIRLRAQLPIDTKIVIFSDSKIALSAAQSKRKPIMNPAITLALRASFHSLSRIFPVNLQWIRGHSGIGGNERVDTIAKRFARNSSSPIFTFSGDFPSTTLSSAWHSFPLTVAPLTLFCATRLRPEAGRPDELFTPRATGTCRFNDLDVKHSED